MKQAMLLAAGLGTRLRPLTDTMPKALVPVAGQPLLYHVLQRLKAADIQRVVINVHHFGEQIIEYLTNNTSGHIAIAECLQQDFASIGINMTIKSIDWAVFLNERKEGNFGIARNGWIADFNDPINMLEMWTTVSGNNDAQFGR